MSRAPAPADARRDERGSGMVPAIAGLTVFLMFLLFAVQVLFGLYATSTVRATLHDVASRAAAGGPQGQGQQGTAGPDPARLARLAAEAEDSLGAMGDRTEITLRLVDDDGDGTGDAVVGEAVAVPPRVVPPSIGGMVGFEEVRASVRVRVERFR